MMIRPYHLSAVLMIMLVAGMQPAHAQQAGRLQDRMSASEFYDAGLNKLSAKELANLNQWLAAHQGTSGAAPVTAAATDTAGEAKPETETKQSFFGKVFGKSDRQKIETHMVGHFGGFNGRSLITLDNGQQWQQIGDDKPMCNSSDNPEVTVKPSLFGNWLMNVHGCNGLVHVKRTK